METEFLYVLQMLPHCKHCTTNKKITCFLNFTRFDSLVGYVLTVLSLSREKSSSLSLARFSLALAVAYMSRLLLMMAALSLGDWVQGAQWHWGDGRWKVWIHDSMYILPNPTFWMVNHAEAAVADVASIGSCHFFLGGEQTSFLSFPLCTILKQQMPNVLSISVNHNKCVQESCSIFIRKIYFSVSELMRCPDFLYWSPTARPNALTLGAYTF